MAKKGSAKEERIIPLFLEGEPLPEIKKKTGCSLKRIQEVLSCMALSDVTSSLKPSLIRAIVRSSDAFDKYSQAQEIVDAEDILPAKEMTVAAKYAREAAAKGVDLLILIESREKAEELPTEPVAEPEGSTEGDSEFEQIEAAVGHLFIAS